MGISARFAGISISVSLFAASLAFAPPAFANVERVQFKNQDHALTFEILTDSLLHFDYAPLSSTPSLTQNLGTTPLVILQNSAGPQHFQSSGQGFETNSAQVQIDLATLCFTLIDKLRGDTLTHACPSMTSSGNALTLDALKMQNIYGLGEQFQPTGQVNGDWSGKIRAPGNKYGNSMVAFAGGNNGNAQFPVMYALGPNSLNYAFYLDTVYPYQWDFTSSPWKITQTLKGTDPSFRGYFFLGTDLPALRSAYMDLVGRPPVPPKKAFGMWVSEFGYRNWGEIQDKLTTLRANHFPVDGFVLDLYWFGQYVSHSPSSAMGTLQWDTKNFPNPANQIASFQKNDGVGLMTIEESYVSSNLANFQSMASRGFFVEKDATSSQPTIYDTWWGKGGGIDWSQPAAGAAWHNEHRKKQLTDLGITFHWTDLGEPEAFADNNFYRNPNGIGQTEADAHNLYNFYWDKSIFEGYESNQEFPRHFILSRSGTTGIQRFGAAMWSGDIGPNMTALTGTLNAQMHMGLSGIDYFGSDVGGFMRSALVGDPNEVYTRWFANSSLFDVPLRPHTDNGSKTHPTAPDRIGDLKSNLANLRQRYELAPYYYSLAYGAYRTGAQVIPPLVYYFQTDQNVRQIADEKMVGPFLMGATTSTLGQTSRDVYLPAGDWIDYHSLTWYHSPGKTFPAFNLQNNGLWQLPLFARAGAILPKAKVDELTMNILGKRMDGSLDQDLRVRVFASAQPTEFHLVEDDGVTESYRNGDFAETLISQVLGSTSETVTVAATSGNYSGAPTVRNTWVELVLNAASVSKVAVNGNELQKVSDLGTLDHVDSGWFSTPDKVIHAKAAKLPVTTVKTFEFTLTH